MKLEKSANSLFVEAFGWAGGDWAFTEVASPLGLKSLKLSLAAADEKSANTPGDVFVAGAAVAVTGPSKRSVTRSLD